MGQISISENWNYEDPTVVVEDYCPWSVRQQAAYGLLGGWQDYGGFLTYLPPMSYPDAPGLVCKSVTTDHIGDIDPYTGDWGTAKITINYAKPENQTVDFGELDFDVSGEALSFPPGFGFKWSEGPDINKKLSDTDVTPQALIITTDIGLKRKSPFLFLDQLENTVGKINSTTLTVGSKSYGINKVLFCGAKVSRKFSSDANELWEYQFKFMARPNSWNKFPHKSGSLYGITPVIYSQADLNFWFN